MLLYKRNASNLSTRASFPSPQYGLCMSAATTTMMIIVIKVSQKCPKKVSIPRVVDVGGDDDDDDIIEGNGEEI